MGQTEVPAGGAERALASIFRPFDCTDVNCSPQKSASFNYAMDSQLFVLTWGAVTVNPPLPSTLTQSLSEANAAAIRLGSSSLTTHEH
jgi:hypothetical protein